MASKTSIRAEIRYGITLPYAAPTQRNFMTGEPVPRKPPGTNLIEDEAAARGWTVHIDPRASGGR